MEGEHVYLYIINSSQGRERVIFAPRLSNYDGRP
jgi:hypothetical protein